MDGDLCDILGNLCNLFYNNNSNNNGIIFGRSSKLAQVAYSKDF